MDATNTRPAPRPRPRDPRTPTITTSAQLGQPLAALGFAVLSTLAIPAAAEVFTVGPFGSHPTVQSAIDAAALAGGDNEVRLAAGETFTENLSILATGGSLTISGGWDGNFFEQIGRSTIDGGLVGRVARIRLADTDSLQLSELDLTRGKPWISDPSQFAGGGLKIDLEDGATLDLVRVALFDNHVDPPGGTGTAHGAGLKATLQGTSRMSMRSSKVEHNELRAPAGRSALGAGLQLDALGSSTVELLEVDIGFNLATLEDNQVSGVGLALYTEDAASLRWIGGRVVGNLAEGTGPTLATGSLLELSGSGEHTIRRVLWTSNEDRRTPPAISSPQIVVGGAGGLDLTWTDSQVDSGLPDGVRVTMRDTSRLQAANLTIAGHPGTGLVVDFEAVAPSLYNSIVALNGSDVDLQAGVEVGSSILGGDPGFSRTGPGTFELGSGSPALDAGDLTPPGGLGPLDLGGHARVIGPGPDLGAHEVHPLFADGFEAGDISAWSG